MSAAQVRKSFEYGRILGEQLAKTYDYVVISESCAGGTTTALAVLLAMGTVRENLVSSSSPKNPKQFKWDTVMQRRSRFFASRCADYNVHRFTRSVADDTEHVQDCR